MAVDEGGRAGSIGREEGLSAADHRIDNRIRFCSFPRQPIPSDARRPPPLPPTTEYDGSP